MRVADGAEIRRLVRRSHPELIAVRAPDNNRARLFQTLQGRCRVERLKTLEHLRSTRYPPILLADYVFHREDEPMQRPHIPLCQLSIELVGAAEGIVTVDRQKRVQISVSVVDSLQKTRDQLSTTGLGVRQRLAVAGVSRMRHG